MPTLARCFRAQLQFVAIFVGLFALRSSFADQYVIPSGSMEPTIQIGDHVWVNKFAYDLKVPFTNFAIARTGSPQRGDVIVFEDPRDPSINLIKRLVGVPGDHIKIVDGFVAVNGARLETSPIHGGASAPKMSATFEYQEKLGGTYHSVQRIPRLARHESEEVTVPEGRYFFMGDNRDNSADSRQWGFASREALKGKAMNVIYTVQWQGWIPIPKFERSGLAL